MFKPLLATLLIALALGLTACSDSDDAAGGTTADAGDGESTSLTIDTENNATSYDSGDTSISVNAQDGESQEAQ